MKNALDAVRIGLCALALGTGEAALGQPFGPFITSLSGRGVLVCSDLPAGSVATLEWASSATGPWTNNWAGLNAVTVGASGMIQVGVPMFYRVCATNSVGSGPVPSGMALIPAGGFTMGDTLDGNGDGDATPISVTVSAFCMDTNLVSYSQWQTVYNWATSHGYAFYQSPYGPYVAGGKAANHPVQTVDWYDCVKWCNARSEMEGKIPAYYMDLGLSVPYRTGEVAPYVNWSGGYRLPTEAEWEKAARGGLSGQRFPWGDTISWSQANYYGYPLSLTPYGYAYDLATAIDYDPAFSGGDNGDNPFTSPVGTFPANGYGLNDMAGNVLEWCWDWYATLYAGGTDPRGPTSGSVRVDRGGGWGGRAGICRTAYRNYRDPTFYFIGLGFRSVLPSGQ